MRSVCIVVAFTMLIGCAKPKEKIMGDSAPYIGSSPSYSTMEQFVVGRWQETADPTKEPKNGSPTAAMLEIDWRIIEFKKDGTYAISFAKKVGEAHGTWQANGYNVYLALKDVDGLTKDQIDKNVEKHEEANKREHDLKQMLGIRERKRIGTGADGDREFVYMMTRDLTNLTLTSDGKSLIDARILQDEEHPDTDRSIYCRITPKK